MKSCFDRLAVAVALCMALATAAQAAFEGREILRRPDMCNVDMVDTVSWYAQESVRLEVEPWRCGRRVEIPEGSTAAWVVADEGGTNWIVRYDSAPSSNLCAFALAAGEGNLPSGHDYTGYVSLLRGTNILGVLDRHEVAVLGQAADGGSEISPDGGCWGSLLERMAEAERGILGLSHDVATNALYIAELEEAKIALDARIDSLWGECVGGFRWPDYFVVNGYETGVLPGTVTNTATATQTVYNVVVETVENALLKGWRINAEVVRQSDWTNEVVWEAVMRLRKRKLPPGVPGITTPYSSIDPAKLEIEGDVVHFADGVESAGSDFAAVRGTLGDFTVTALLEFDTAKQSTTSAVRRFAGPAPGSLLETSWDTVLGAATNGHAQGKHMHLRTWPEGYGSGTNHVTATWNTNFWAWGMGDFSCISYHTETAPGIAGGVYRPITMVTPRHGICAQHFAPYIGSNCYWVTRSGGVATNRIMAWTNIRGDLMVVRLDHAFDTNDITPAKLLASGWHSYLYGSTNALSGLLGIPVLGFDCAERGYLMRWETRAMSLGRTGGIVDESYFKLQSSRQGQEWPYFRGGAVGGDSGSPVFWPVDGHTVLLGCFSSPQNGPLPTKEEVDAAIEAWGDEERVVAYDLQDGGWPNPDLPGAPGQ